MSVGRHTAGLEPQPPAPPPASPPPPAAEAVLAWAAARDAALRGLVHALSNRVGTVAAVGGMLDADAPPASVGTAARVLAGEGERLEALLAHFRLLAADPWGADAAPEPVHVPELAAEVRALAAAAGWDVADDAGDAGPAEAVPPAFVARAAAAHAALVLLHAARAAAGGGAAALTAARHGAQPAVRVAGWGGAPAVTSPAARAACAWLLGPAAVADGGAELRLPPLAPPLGSESGTPR